MAYAGLTDGDRKNAHVKVNNTLDNGWYLAGQLYVVDDDEEFDSTAYQLAFMSAKTYGAYSVRAEATYTAAESIDSTAVGNMSYRLTSAYGGSNGTYDIWWNNRSDFNHDGEFAGFASVSRDFSDVGAQASVPVCRVHLVSPLPISAVSMICSSMPAACLRTMRYRVVHCRGANLGFYYTEYINDTDVGNWAPYTNLFQDESDIKVTLTIPFTIK